MKAIKFPVDYIRYVIGDIFVIVSFYDIQKHHSLMN